MVKEAVFQEFTASFTAEQNGPAEREMRTIVESACSMLYACDVPIYILAEAVNCAVLNGQHRVKHQTFDLWHGVKPSLDNIIVFV